MCRTLEIGWSLRTGTQRTSDRLALILGLFLDSTYELEGQSTSTGGNLLSNPVAKPINAKINSLVNHVVLEVSKAFSPAMAVAA